MLAAVPCFGDITAAPAGNYIRNTALEQQRSRFFVSTSTVKYEAIFSTQTNAPILALHYWNVYGADNTIGFLSLGQARTHNLVNGDIFLGLGAGGSQYTVVGGGNTGLGHNALASLVDGYSNVAVGNYADSYINSGSDNICIGSQCHINTTNDSAYYSNVLIGGGQVAPYYNNHSSIFIGYHTGWATDSAGSPGDNNIQIGREGGIRNAQNFVTSVGGYNLIYASRSIALGNYIVVSTEAYQSVAIGYGTTVSSANTVVIGSTNPADANALNLVLNKLEWDRTARQLKITANSGNAMLILDNDSVNTANTIEYRTGGTATGYFFQNTGTTYGCMHNGVLDGSGEWCLHAPFFSWQNNGEPNSMTFDAEGNLAVGDPSHNKFNVTGNAMVSTTWMPSRNAPTSGLAVEGAVVIGTQTANGAHFRVKASTDFAYEMAVSTWDAGYDLVVDTNGVTRAQWLTTVKSATFTVPSPYGTAFYVEQPAYAGPYEGWFQFSQAGTGYAKIGQKFYSNALPNTFNAPLIFSNSSAYMAINATGQVAIGGDSVDAMLTVFGNQSVGATRHTPPANGLYVEGSIQNAALGNNLLICTDGSGKLTTSGCPSGGSGNPSAPDTSVQFNNGGSFGGSSSMTWSGGLLTLNNPGTNDLSLLVMNGQAANARASALEIRDPQLQTYTGHEQIMVFSKNSGTNKFGGIGVGEDGSYYPKLYLYNANVIGGYDLDGLKHVMTFQTKGTSSGRMAGLNIDDPTDTFDIVQAGETSSTNRNAVVITPASNMGAGYFNIVAKNRSASDSFTVDPDGYVTASSGAIVGAGTPGARLTVVSGVNNQMQDAAIFRTVGTSGGTTGQRIRFTQGATYDPTYEQGSFEWLDAGGSGEQFSLWLTPNGLSANRAQMFRIRGTSPSTFSFGKNNNGMGATYDFQRGDSGSGTSLAVMRVSANDYNATGDILQLYNHDNATLKFAVTDAGVVSIPSLTSNKMVSLDGSSNLVAANMVYQSNVFGIMGSTQTGVAINISLPANNDDTRDTLVTHGHCPSGPCYAGYQFRTTANMTTTRGFAVDDGGNPHWPENTNAATIAYSGTSGQVYFDNQSTGLSYGGGAYASYGMVVVGGAYDTCGPGPRGICLVNAMSQPWYQKITAESNLSEMSLKVHLWKGLYYNSTYYIEINDTWGGSTTHGWSFNDILGERIYNARPIGFLDADNSHYVAFKASATITSSMTYTWPDSFGTPDQVLALKSVNGNNADLYWKTDATSAGGGDNLGNHVATMTLTAGYGAIISTAAIGDAASTTFGDNPYAVIAASGTSRALDIRIFGTPSGGAQNQLGAITIFSTQSVTSPATHLVSVDSTTDPQNGYGLWEIWENAPGHNDPLIWIHDVGKNSAPFMRVDAQAPNFELINTSTDNAHGLGKWEPFAMAYQGVELQINNRSWDNGTFENLAEWMPLTKNPSGLRFYTQNVVEDAGVWSSSDTSVTAWYGLNSSWVGLTGPLNPSGSWTFALPSTPNNQYGILYQANNGRGKNLNARQWEFSGVDFQYNPASGVSISTATVYRLNVTSTTVFTAQFYAAKVSKGNSGSAITIDWGNGNTQAVTLTADCTFTFTNGKAGAHYTLEVKQDGNGNHAAIWPSTVKWTGGTTPTVTQTAGITSVVTFYFSDPNYAAAILYNVAL